MDVFSPERRSAIMRRVQSKNTRPELVVRKLVCAAGYRYRLHTADVPGRPDLVFRGRKKAIFVNGCFWHRHTCRSAALPKSNRAYWEKKQARNATRDRRNLRALRASRWKVLTVWECETKNLKKLQNRLQRFLES
jgi:DNA mismatch endonuclease (patch repair protein)